MPIRIPTVALFVILTALFPFGPATAAEPAQSHRTHESQHAKRIITIAPNAAEILCALGVCDRIVGVDKFCVHPLELSERPRVGGLFDPDLERIVALNPDLVVLRGRCEAVEKLCRERGFALYRDPTERLADIERTAVELARLVGRKSDGVRLAGDFRGRLEEIRRRTAGRPRPRVLVTISREPQRTAAVMTTGPATFLDEAIEIAGGSNVFKDVEMAYPQVSAESIVARRPEVIIEFMPDAIPSADRREQLLADWKEFGSVPAVTNGRIHLITDAHALIPSLRYVEIVDRIAQWLHADGEMDGESKGR